MRRCWRCCAPREVIVKSSTRMSEATLIRQLANRGVRRGGVLLVHASFRAVRPVEGGPLGVIRALAKIARSVPRPTPASRAEAPCTARFRADRGKVIASGAAVSGRERQERVGCKPVFSHVVVGHVRQAGSEMSFGALEDDRSPRIAGGERAREAAQAKSPA